MLEAYFLLILFTIFGSLGGFFFKRATLRSKDFRGIFFNYNTYIGFFLYFISAAINIYVLILLPYSIVLPCSAITYIWSLMLGNKFLMEYVGKFKVGGVILIIVGVILIVFGS
jgi:drug/metabolite transporter (DMT)-like permease